MIKIIFTLNLLFQAACACRREARGGLFAFREFRGPESRAEALSRRAPCSQGRSACPDLAARISKGPSSIARARRSSRACPRRKRRAHTSTEARNFRARAAPRGGTTPS